MTEIAAIGEFHPILSKAQPDQHHHWMLKTADVAEGFGITPETVRAHKSNHKDELLENHHWFNSQAGTLWSRAGVIRLGMFINSDRAKKFRDAAERYLMGAVEPLKNSTTGAMTTVLNALDPISKAIAQEIIARELPGRVEAHLNSMLADRLSLEQCLGKLGLPIPSAWAEMFESQ